MENLLTQGVGVVGRLGLFGGGQMISGTTAPKSGTSGTPKGARAGSIYRYVSAAGAVDYVNEGTKTAPYWTPINFLQPALLGVYEDFRGPDPKPIADTTASLNAASGLRSFGQGVAEIDSGVLKGTDVEGSHVGVMRTTNEDEHVVAIGMGTSVAMLQPDTHGPLVVDITWSQLTDILTRRIFVGFLGAVADALDPPATGATTVITLVQDDMAGFFMDSNLTDADGLFLAHNKSDAAATIATTATGVDISQSLAAAGTYQRMRIEIDASGNMVAFINKTQVGSITAALDADEECMPVALLAVEQGTTILNATVKSFMAWGFRG